MRVTSPKANKDSGVTLTRAGSGHQVEAASDIASAYDGMAEPSATESLFRSNEIISAITDMSSSKITDSNVSVQVGEGSTEIFNRTQRNRGLLNGKESYFHTLICAAGNPELKATALRELNGKRIINLGGGNARLGADLAEQGVTPASITNVEPYPSDDVLANPKGFDALLTADSADTALLGSAPALQAESADEVWAAFSVPFYLETPEQVSSMLSNRANLLAPGGNLRIWPLALNREGSTEESIAGRKQGLTSALGELANKGFAVDLISTGNRGPTLIVHRPQAEEISAKH